MSIDFYPPALRAQGGSGGLNVTVSPLGLIELSDEEYQVHGARLARYALLWSWYLGSHWATVREAGEPQLTFNFIRAFTDFICNFCFARGVTFKSPLATSAIIPALLNRVWTVDNNREKLLWEIGQMGGVTGDCFVKVAYEEPQMWPPMDPENPVPGVRQRFLPGRVRIIPLNSSYCFPIWNPHDRSRLIQFTQKYRFWAPAADGTRQMKVYVEVITDTEIREYVDDVLLPGSPRPNPLGRIPVVHIPNTMVSGSPWGLADCQDILGQNRAYNEVATEVLDIVNYYCVDTETEALTRDGWKRYDQLRVGDDVLALDPVSDEITWQPLDAVHVWDYDGPLVKWNNRIDAVTTPNHRWLAERRIGRPENKRYERQIARTALATDGDPAVADLREGSRLVVGGGTPLGFPTVAKWSDELVETVGWYVTEGNDRYSPQGWHSATISQSPAANPEKVADIRRLAAYWQAEGATFTESAVPQVTGSLIWYLGKGVKEVLEEVAPSKALTPQFIASLTYYQAKLLRKVLLDGDGTRAGERSKFYQDDSARVDGYQMLAALLGIRTNDVLLNTHHVCEYQKRTIDTRSTIQRATLTTAADGKVWCPEVQGGIWFARRNGNTYWTGNTAPVTVVIGANQQTLQRGANNVWSVPKGAEIENLEGGQAGIPAALNMMAYLKSDMYSLVGVPEGALGTAQPVSNTAGVALAIQYQPMMQRYDVKKINYGQGIKDVNEIVLLTLSIKEPETAMWAPKQEGDELKPGQLAELDWDDPATYYNEVCWPSPLPVDLMRALAEQGQKMAMGLQSKKGALREFGEEFPDEKMQEVFAELLEDAIDQGAIDMLRAQIAASVLEKTGMLPPDGSEPGVTSAGGSDVNSAGDASGGGSGDEGGSGQPGRPPLFTETPEGRQVTADLQARIVGTKVVGTKLPGDPR